jgi:hypothetical protein
VSGHLGNDNLLLAVINRGANKLDPLTSVKATMTTKPVGRDTEVTLKVDLENRTPAKEVPYVEGLREAGVPPGTYVGLVSVDIPSRAGNIRVDPPGVSEVSGPDYGPTVVAVPVQFDRGKSTSVTFRFVFSGSHGALTVAPSARIPGTDWTGPNGNFADDLSHVVRW